MSAAHYFQLFAAHGLRGDNMDERPHCVARIVPVG